jgi:acyl-CoA thioesterase
LFSILTYVKTYAEAKFAPEIINRTPNKSEKTLSNNIKTKSACIKKSGEWNEDINYKYCVIAYSDAGNLCTTSKDCNGHCIWPLNGKTLDGKSLNGHGICQLNDSIDDCGRPHFENGKIIYFNCD